MEAFRAPMRELGEFEEIRAALPKNRGMLQAAGGNAPIISRMTNIKWCANRTEEKGATNA